MKNKVVIVTGGSRGIGAGISEAFYKKGARVVINYHRNHDAAKTLVSNLGGPSDSIILVNADVSTSQGRKCLLDKTIEHFGTLALWTSWLIMPALLLEVVFLKELRKNLTLLLTQTLKALFF